MIKASPWRPGIPPAERSWENPTHTWRRHKMTCVNTAESLSLSSSSSSLFKVCVSHVLLTVESSNREGPRHVHKQPHPECYTQTGSASGEEQGGWSTDTHTLWFTQVEQVRFPLKKTIQIQYMGHSTELDQSQVGNVLKFCMFFSQNFVHIYFTISKLHISSKRTVHFYIVFSDCIGMFFLYRNIVHTL